MREYKITNEDFLLRRFPISDEPKYVVFWKFNAKGQKIPSSAAFKTKPNEDGLSVDVAVLTKPEQTAGNINEFGVAQLSASTPIELGYNCVHDPQEGNIAHALILGDTNPIAKKLSRAVTQTFILSTDE